eukprot:gene17240-23565_t
MYSSANSNWMSEPCTAYHGALGEPYSWMSQSCSACDGALPPGFNWLDQNEVGDNYKYTSKDVICMNGSRMVYRTTERPTVTPVGAPCEPDSIDSECVLQQWVQVDSFSDTFVDVMRVFSTVNACCDTWNGSMAASPTLPAGTGGARGALVSDVSSDKDLNFVFGQGITVFPLNENVGPFRVTQSTVITQCDHGSTIEIPGRPGYVRLVWSDRNSSPPPPPARGPSPPPIPALSVAGSGDDNSAVPLAIGLSVGFGVLVTLLGGVVGILLYRRRHKKTDPDALTKTKQGSSSPPRSSGSLSGGDTGGSGGSGGSGSKPITRAVVHETAAANMASTYSDNTNSTSVSVPPIVVASVLGGPSPNASASASRGTEGPAVSTIGETGRPNGVGSIEPRHASHATPALEHGTSPSSVLSPDHSASDQQLASTGGRCGGVFRPEALDKTSRAPVPAPTDLLSVYAKLAAKIASEGPAAHAAPTKAAAGINSSSAPN